MSISLVQQDPCLPVSGFHHIKIALPLLFHEKII